MNFRSIILAFVLMCSLVSCGYLSSGTWEDDKKNWDRAYNHPLPDTINLIHSWYWRSPHWTLEQAMYFEIDYNEGILHNFIKDSTVRQLDYRDTLKLYFFNTKPKWFLPKPYRSYFIWIGKKDKFDNFMLFMDSEIGHLYWTDSQF